MNTANRCPKCGGLADTFIVDITGKEYFRCTNGLTHFSNQKGKLVIGSEIRMCNTVLDERGQQYHGFIAYVSSNGLKTEVVA